MSKDFTWLYYIGLGLVLVCLVIGQLPAAVGFGFAMYCSLRGMAAAERGRVYEESYGNLREEATKRLEESAKQIMTLAKVASRHLHTRN